MSDSPLILLKGRAQTIKDACAQAKIESDALSGMAMLYLSLKLLKMPHVDKVFEGPLQDVLSVAIDHLKSTHARPDDPDAPITMTQSELLLLMHQKVGSS